MNERGPQQKMKRMLEMEKWLTVKELAAYIGTTPGAIRNMVYRGQLTAYKPFGRLLFKKSEVDRLIERHEVE